MERLSVRERERISELLSEGAPFWRLRQEVPCSIAATSGGRAEFGDDPEMRVSHETIYVSLFVQTRGALRKERARYLRLRHRARRPGGKPARIGQSHIPAMVNIRERPAEIDDCAVPGHWEGDLLYGRGPGVVATLVERHSRFVMLVGLPERHSADVVAAALATKMTELPVQLRRFLTWDQGREMAQHQTFTVASGVSVYFCDPAQPLAAGHEREHQRLAAPIPPSSISARTAQPSRTRPHARRFP